MITKSVKKRALKIALFIFTAIILACPKFIYVNADTEAKLYLGGYAAGFTIVTKGAEVLGLSDVITDLGVVSPAKDAGIQENDLILNIGGKETNSFEDLESVLDLSKGRPLMITIKRNDEILIKEITPVKDISGKFKLGLFVRDRLTGIGTITYVKKDGEVMALGHPIIAEDEKPIEIKSGELFSCSIFGIEKGIRGKAGELRGMFITDARLGVISKNLTVGIKGKLDDGFDKSNLSEIEVGTGHPGNASILTTVEGTVPKEFSISIVKFDKNSKDNRNFVIKITDKNLLQIAGGIVQGMSGSPIIQDGKIIGAITHVFLNDPTRGYGIDIEKMLNA